METLSTRYLQVTQGEDIHIYGHSGAVRGAVSSCVLCRHKHGRCGKQIKPDECVSTCSPTGHPDNDLLPHDG